MSRIARRMCCAALLIAALAAPSVASADNYVALGDSYSSGVGTNSYSLSSSCLRGTKAYPYLLSQQRPNTSLNFVACSGATTDTLMASQISAVNSSTNIVTVTIGGNDAGFASTVTACTLGSCTSQIAAANAYIQNTLPGKLNTVYNAIKTQASPTAKVVVLGYPRLFSSSSCFGTFGLSAGERTSMNATADLLDATTAARAAAYGFTYKSAIAAFTGHAVCSSEWLNGLNIFNTTESFHPNTTGHSSGYLPLVRQVTG